MSGGGQVAVVDFLGIEKSNSSTAAMETGGQVVAANTFEDNSTKNSKPGFNFFSNYFRENRGNVDNAVMNGLKRTLELSNENTSFEKDAGHITVYATARMKAQARTEEAKRTIQPINISLDLSSCPSRNSMELFSREDEHKLGFGSPIPISVTKSQYRNSTPTNSENEQDNIVPKAARQPQQWLYSGTPLPFRGVHAQNAVGLARCPASMIPGKQLGAQLTIFYAGTVNVYDDVPADKAQAIMLLADSGIADSSKFWNSNFKNTALIPNYTSEISNSINSMGAMSRTMFPQNTGGQTVTPKPFPPVSFSSGDQNQKPPANKLQADLPLARKHSLQRFLEKRKDRLNSRTKNPYSAGESSQVSNHASRYPPLFDLSCNENSQHSSPSHSK